MAILEDKKLCILDFISPIHLITLDIDKTFFNITVAKSRMQNYVFSQEFAIIILNHNRVQQILVLICRHYKTYTKN